MNALLNHKFSNIKWFLFPNTHMATLLRNHIQEFLYSGYHVCGLQIFWQSGFNFAFIRNFSPTPATDPNSCTRYVWRTKPNFKRWITIMTLLNYITTKQSHRMHKVHKQCVMYKVCDVVYCSLWQLLTMVTYTLHYQNHVSNHVNCPNTIFMPKPFYEQFIPCNV